MNAFNLSESIASYLISFMCLCVQFNGNVRLNDWGVFQITMQCSMHLMLHEWMNWWKKKKKAQKKQLEISRDGDKSPTALNIEY